MTVAATMPDLDLRACPLGVAPLAGSAGAACSVLVWAPNARRVTVEVERAGERVAHELEPLADGYHGSVLDDMPHGTRYGIRMDAGPVRPDPASRWQPDGVHERSAVFDPSLWSWGDDDWRALPLRDYVIYELHVGTFTPAGTFDAAAERLPELASLGVTAVELMPVAQFPGARGWGYDAVNLYAAHASYGGPQALQRFVDAAHAAGLAVVLDVVYNHLGPEGNYLAEFGPYFSARHHTPWGAGVNVDDRGSDEVRRFFIENALMWLEHFHVDSLRLDAVHGVIDTSARPFFAELADRVHEQAREHERQLLLIAESDLGDVRVITPAEQGGWGHDAQWCDDFHHALHALLTGERDGYYVDFGTLEHLAEAWRHGFVYRGQRSRFRRRRFGSDTRGRTPEQFVVYAQNHDQVGNRMRGDRAIAALDPERQKLALASVLLAPFTPMLFMGEEYGEQRPFPYFVSHGDAALVEAVRRGRKAEFAEFRHDGEPPDPAAEATFRSAVLEWESRARGTGRELLEWTRRLLQLRRDHVSLRPATLEQTDVECADGVLCVQRVGQDERSLLELGFERPLAAPAAGTAGQVLLQSRHVRFTLLGKAAG